MAFTATGHSDDGPEGAWPRASRALAHSFVKGRIRMKSLKSNLFVIGCLLVGLCSPAWATEPVLPIGQPVNGTISSFAQVNRYSLAANKGDVLDFTVLSTSSTSGTFSAAIQLVNSSGTVIDSAWNGIYGVNNGPCSSDNSLAMDNVSIPASGTYTVLINDCNNADEGDYTLYVQRLDGPPASVNLPYSEASTGKVAAKPEMNPYTFSANKNDVIDFEVLSTSGSLSAAIQLVNSTGTVLDYAWNGIYGANNGPCSVDNTLTMDQVSIPASGIYTLFVYDCSLWNTGNYSIWMQKMNSPDGAVPIVFDQVQTGTINSLAQKNVYSFTVDTGDKVDLIIAATGGKLSPFIQLFKADGTLLQNAWNGIYGVNNGPCSGGSTLNVGALQTSGAGTYYLFVADCSRWNTGSYQFSTQCFGVCPLPAPVLTSLVPNSALAGSKSLTLTLYGSSFANVESNSVVEWGNTNTELVTTFVSTTELQAVIPAADLKVPGHFTVRVCTPPPGGGCSKDLTFTVLGPVITSPSPGGIIAGGPAFTLTVNGANFVNGSVVNWNGKPCNASPCTTTYVSATQLTVSVPATYIATAAVVELTVTNPSPGGTSSQVPFYVDNPVPKLTSLLPASIIAGGSGFTLTLTGSGFVKGSLVEWNGKGLTTTYVSPTELQATVPASDTLDGDISITVFNSLPGGGTSNPKTLPIDNPVPVVISILPASVKAGSGSFTLTVNGFDFNEGAKVQWNGIALSTVFVSDMQLQAAVPANDVATAGSATVTVANPAPTPSPSNPVTFTIN
jgi:hypothetical protein